jgi:hypothetical protein
MREGSALKGLITTGSVVGTIPAYGNDLAGAVGDDRANRQAIGSQRAISEL